MVKVNPNSPIRSGYKYEDLFVLKLCVDWLKNPERFRKIQIQYTPEGLSGFAMDDVVVTLANGNCDYYQLKYKQNPDNHYWDFAHLLDKGLLRWIDSYSKLLSSGINKCFLITNGHHIGDVSTCISNNRIEFKKLKDLYPLVYDQIFVKFNDEDFLNRFFLDFHFEFSYAGKSEFEKQLRLILSDDLKVTKAGIDSLLLFIGDQGTEKYPKDITLREIRNHLSWDNPKPLNQNFRVPSDFEFFDTSTHEQIISDLSDITGGIKVIIGKPGSGKSTYLSKLYTLLKKNNITVARHHYHLNPKDRSYRDRLNTERVIEGLRAEFKKLKTEVLGELASTNTQHTPLREFIKKISTYYSLQNRTFVLIIDGLDHVIREGQNEEDLKGFLNEVLQPQKGFWLILGTQEMAVRHFPNTVYGICPRENWIEIKGLRRESVRKIINKTFTSSKSNKLEAISSKTHNELFNLTKGNPLHLRYVLTEIKGSHQFISSYDLKRIPAYKGDISEYYADIWRQLSSLAKTFCYAITAIDFRLHKEQLFELAGYLTNSPHEITDGFREIEHLVTRELSGISVYHNSFMVFMGNQPELLEQRKLLYRNIRLWLKDCNDDLLKWSETAKVEYELGNPAPILNLDKDWIVSSYLECKPESQILNLLELATKAAFECRNDEKTVYFSTLARNFEQRGYNLWENLQKIWVTAFNANPNIKISYPDFSSSTHYQLKELLILLKERGMITSIPEEARDRIIELSQDRDNEGFDLVKSWIEVQIRFEEVEDIRILRLIRQNGKTSSTSLLSFYLKKLLENKHRYSKRIQSLLQSKLNNAEKDALAHGFIEEDLLNGNFEWSNEINLLLTTKNNKSFLYDYLRDGKLPHIKALRSYSKFPSKYDYSSSRSNHLLMFVDQFYKTFFLSFISNSETVNKFLSHKPKKWKNQFIHAVVEIAWVISAQFKRKDRLELIKVLSPLDNLHTLDFYKDHDIYEIRRAVSPRIIDEIIWICKVLNSYNDYPQALNSDEVKFLADHELYYKSSFFDLLHNRHATLTDDGFSKFMEIELENLAEELIPFKDKTERMANLAILAKDLKKTADLNTLLYKAAENILSYGNHKDMFLYDLLLSIDKCGVGGARNVNEYLRQVAPYILQMDKLTDGDETGSFVYKFTELLAKYDNQSLYHFYLETLKSREYYLSESIFGNILETLDHSNNIDRAIANTAIGDITYNSLESLSEKNQNARTVLNEIRSDLGKVDYSRDRRDETKIEKNKSSKPTDNYENIPANALSAKLSTLEKGEPFRKYEVSRYLFGWAEYWLNIETADRSPIIIELRKLITLDFPNTDDKLLDLLYPHALDVDRNFAFNCICWAASNSGQWSSDYFSKPEEAKKRWSLVIQDFPSRLDEFYRTSLMNSGRKYGDRTNYSIPIPKSTQFYIDTQRLPIAESITQAYLNLLPVLFPNVNLPIPAFYEQEKKHISPLDILFTRLDWMSPIVRERTANQLITILTNDVGGEYHNHLFTWLKKIKLESKACEALMIILVSVEEPESASRRYITQANLGSLLSLRSMATDLIQLAIADRLTIKLNLAMPLFVSMIFTRPKIEEEEFTQLVGRNVPVSYLDNIQELQKGCPVEIWSAWYNIYKSRCEILGLEYTRDDERYCNDFNSIMPGRTTIFGDVLRSTFSQLLDYLHSEGYIDFNDLFYYTIKNFTVEPSSLRRKVSTKPVWWPKLTGLKNNDNSAILNKTISSILKSIPNKQILSLEGTVYEQENFYHNKIFCTISAMAFAYDGDLEEITDNESFYRKVSSFSGYWQPRMQRTIDFGIFSDELKYQRGKEPESNKLRIVPLVAPVRSLNVNIWQYYRAFHHNRFFVPELKNGAELHNLTTGFKYLTNSKEIGGISEFLDGLRDSSEIPEMIPYGTYTTIDHTTLDSHLSKYSLRIAYVVQKKWSIKETNSKRDGFKYVYEYEMIKS